jgi:hypothetical protein
MYLNNVVLSYFFALLKLDGQIFVLKQITQNRDKIPLCAFRYAQILILILIL